MIHCLAMIIHEQKKYEDYLNSSSLQFTRGRRVVFNEVMHAHGHFAPEELLKQCRHKGRKISRATVYRTLKELLEAGVVRETAFGEKHHHFEHLYDEKRHHHARCIRCHALVEFPDLHEEKLYKSVLQELGFQVVGHEMHFYGICQACRKA